MYFFKISIIEKKHFFKILFMVFYIFQFFYHFFITDNRIQIQVSILAVSASANIYKEYNSMEYGILSLLLSLCQSWQHYLFLGASTKNLAIGRHDSFFIFSLSTAQAFEFSRSDLNAILYMIGNLVNNASLIYSYATCLYSYGNLFSSSLFSICMPLSYEKKCVLV